LIKKSWLRPAFLWPEGVEQEDQAKVLRLLRCEQMQGYLFSKPLPFEKITEMLRAVGTPS
jgi:EAL domain-containing protein (putative c-di-GMP-specific phosphodiesterase class I)